MTFKKSMSLRLLISLSGIKELTIKITDIHSFNFIIKNIEITI